MKNMQLHYFYYGNLKRNTMTTQSKKYIESHSLKTVFQHNKFYYDKQVIYCIPVGRKREKYN